MLCKTSLLILVVIVFVTVPASGQNWNSGRTGTSLAVDSSLNNGSYIWTFTNLSGTSDDGTAGFDVLAWTLQPFNVTVPVEVQAPEGWVWKTSGGWSRFEVDKSNLKYDVDGPALEPGESLIFIYTPAQNGPLVNKGGPAEAVIGFLSHVGAVTGTDSGKWKPATNVSEDRWHEIAAENSTVPEPSSFATALFGLMAFSSRIMRKERQ